MGYKEFIRMKEENFHKCSDFKEKNDLLKEIISWEMKNGNYKNARSRLMSSDAINNSAFLPTFANLEIHEANFNKSHEYIDILRDETNNSFSAIYLLSRTLMQEGNFKEAESLLKDLRKVNNYYVSSIFALVEICIIKGDFYKGFELLNSMDVSNLSKREMLTYNDLTFWVKYYLGMLDNEDFRSFDSQYSYKRYRMYNANEIILLDHVKKHISHNNKHGFSENLNLEDVLNFVKGKMPDLNSIYIPGAFKYVVVMDSCIGYVYGEETCAVEVIVYAGKILTFYPVAVSKEFDQESNLSSKSLRFRRIKEGLVK